MKDTCEESEYDDKRHDWNETGRYNAYGQCWLYDYKCRFCGRRKWVAIDPTEPFDDPMYWETDE